MKEARILAKKIGFEKFLEKKTTRFIQGDYTYRKKSDKIFNKAGKVTGLLKESPNSRKDFEKVIKKYASWNQYINTTPILCKFKQERKALFIDFEALVWPCCWVGAPAYCTNPENPQKKQFDKLKNKYEKNFNSLRHHTLSEILSHQWFSSDLVQS